jgi:hypothetical protein
MKNTRVIVNTPANNNKRCEERPRNKLFFGSLGSIRRKAKKMIPSKAAKPRFGINNPCFNLSSFTGNPKSQLLTLVTQSRRLN